MLPVLTVTHRPSQVMDAVTLHNSLLPVLGESAQESVEDLWNVLESAPYGSGPDCLPLVSNKAHRST
jgi:hypothetical protein